MVRQALTLVSCASLSARSACTSPALIHTRVKHITPSPFQTQTHAGQNQEDVCEPVICFNRTAASLARVDRSFVSFPPPPPPELSADPSICSCSPVPDQASDCACFKYAGGTHVRDAEPHDPPSKLHVWRALKRSKCSSKAVTADHDQRKQRRAEQAMTNKTRETVLRWQCTCALRSHLHSSVNRIRA